ncbi:MAG: PASTA domain-containing protein [Bacteroidales bacterium]|jgi:beta-lactam-binding protein with PASTA domain|nr:PASTA domain-containing protein [Bacteroidales bacterium]
MKRFLKFITSKLFLINLLLVIILIALIFIILNVYLNSYTNHGEAVTVPTLIGVNTDEAIEIIETNGFKYEITDTVFDSKFDKNVIVEQIPKSESLVKNGRKIYLTVNSSEDEMVSMPQLVGLSIRQVNSMIETYGLKIGKLRYVPDVAVNVVIKQLHNGDETDAGSKIKKGSEIDLVLGLGLSDKTTHTPKLLGLTYKEASNKLLDAFLNTGAVNYDESVKNKKDSANAKVYKQYPLSDTINKINLGYNVDIWLTIDKDILKSFDKKENEGNNN